MSGDAAEGSGAAALLQEGLALEDRQSLLQTSDLCLTPSLPLFIGLRLGYALIFDLLVVGQDSIQFRLSALKVRFELSDFLVKPLELLCLVLHILLLCHLGDFVLLCLLVVCGLSRRFLCLLLCKVFGEIREDHLKHVNDTTTSPRRFAVSRDGWCWLLQQRLLCLGLIIVTEDLQSLFNSIDTSLKVLFSLKEGSMCVLADLVHLSLHLCQLRQLF